MDDAKVLELARSAGFDISGEFVLVEGYTCNEELLAFARLVAAAERERATRIVLDDMMAVTYQTMGQYRTGLAFHIMGLDQ